VKVVYSEYAKRELIDAVNFYEIEYQGLGEEFKSEVKLASIRILQYPEAWSIDKGEIRKCLLLKFPYKILYSIEADYIFIIAIAHQHRKPDHWIDQ